MQHSVRSYRCGRQPQRTIGPTATRDNLPLTARPFSAVKADDEAQKPRVMARQKGLLEERYDLSDRPMPGTMMSGGTKRVQDGVRVKLAKDQTWQGLAR